MSQGIGIRLFVSRLSFYTTIEQFKSLFSPFGVLTEARLVMDPKIKRTKGFGFVSYRSEIEAEKAMKSLNGRWQANEIVRNLARAASYSFVLKYFVALVIVLLLYGVQKKIVNGRLIFVEPAKSKDS